MRYSFADLIAQPRRVLTSPDLVGQHQRGPCLLALHAECGGLIPWRTLTGRQHFYLDHAYYLQWGEHLPTYKPRPDHTMLDETQNRRPRRRAG